ncbi:hypothetical protein [Sphingobium sp. Z007]|uniref:hypothetical protein n=1 Tax=Sphingobium sp. Z007 TaxID=627495 RepID=UPI000B4A0833|nr:hypothetical protein [Sphingobium sp. Z007]
MSDDPDAMFTVNRQRREALSSQDMLTARLAYTMAFDRLARFLTDKLANVPVHSVLGRSIAWWRACRARYRMDMGVIARARAGARPANI